MRPPAPGLPPGELETLADLQAICSPDYKEKLAAAAAKHGLSTKELEEFVKCHASATTPEDDGLAARETPEARAAGERFAATGSILPQPTESGHGRSGQGNGESVATQLIGIAENQYSFGVSPEGECYAIPSAGPKVVVSLHGNRRALRSQLARDYFRTFRKAASSQSLTDALQVIQGFALESDPEPLHLRVARHDGAIWLDLGDPTGRAVRITAEGWTVEGEAPLLFKRTLLTEPLPEPERGGDIGELWELANIATEDRSLVLGWIISGFYPDISHPILALFGEQGTGKTTAERVIRATIDPSPVPTRKPPKNAEDWVTAAAGSWLVGLDNLSGIPAWLSDSLCRAVTGEGDVRRKLYTDGDYHVFAFRRCILINGIDVGALRGDLSERLLPINLEQIPGNQRREERDFVSVWQQAHPSILGAILDIVAGVAGMTGKDSAPYLVVKPRMADFSAILFALDQLRGTKSLERYLAKQDSVARESLTGEPLIEVIEKEFPDGFTGTAAKLLEHITPEKPPRNWPSLPRVLTQRLRRHAPSMRQAGWHVSDDGAENPLKVAVWELRPPCTEDMAGKSSPPSLLGEKSQSNQSLACREDKGPLPQPIPVSSHGKESRFATQSQGIEGQGCLREEKSENGWSEEL